MRPAVIERAPRFLYALVAVLALAGVVVSAVSLQRHYAKSATDFCELGQKFSCDIVNRSEYSSVEGIPVAAIGVAGYAAIFFLSTFWKSRPETPNRLLAAAAAGFGFALYLTYIEAYRLMTWCILCLASQLLIFLIAMLSVTIKWRSAKA
jgi:uncharacterized membrane protein